MIFNAYTDWKDRMALIFKGYTLGTLVAALVLHIAISLVAPGDAGSMVALGSLTFFLILLILLLFYSLLVFPLAALASLPFRSIVWSRPVLAMMVCIGVGAGLGSIATAIDLRIGPGDYWSGTLVGIVYGAVWFVVVRRSRFGRKNLDTTKSY